MRTATVYTETVLHSSPEPYQVAIVEFPTGDRTTVRIHGPRVSIGDTVTESPEGFRKA